MDQMEMDEDVYSRSVNMQKRQGHEKVLGFHGGMKRPGGSRGHDYYNRINSIRSSYATSFKRRRLQEEQDDKPISAYLNKVERVNWYIKENGRSHKTIKYDLVHDMKESKPVMRRGQVFRMALTFRDRDFNVERDRIALIFKFGAKPSVQKGTMAVVTVKNDKFTKTKDDWDAKIETESSGKDLVLKIHIPANAPVGIWRLDVRSGLQAQYQDSSKFTYSEETDLYILFNPWCKDDGVYMEDASKLEEYVMNDNGKIYKDTHKRPRGRPWAYGQFDDVVLPVASYILELSRLSDSERGNPVRVVRAIAAAVNHYDEGGIMEGKWEGDYNDGVAPDMWTGTVRILEEYVNNGYRPVKYGQCWVFSAVVTSLCRALGIPCRSITNFVSAHDTNSSLTIDNFYDKDGHRIEGGPDGDNTDSIWNFHCWNDTWMARPDLPKGYGGWQAIDATPQEESSSMCNKMQCGPASLEAVRRGDIGMGYDVPYIYSEVNADVMNWGEDQDCDWGFRRMKMDKYEVGRCILTKRPGKEDDNGNTDKEDIIAQYKNQEGAETERMTVHNAIRGYRRARQYYEYKTDIKEDVQFDLYELEKIEVGQPFQVKVVVRNQSNEHRTVSTSLTASSVYYTSIHQSTLKRSDSKFKLGPQQQQDVILTVQFNEYWKKLVEGCLMKIYIICRVEETGQTYTEEDDFVVEKPKLQVALTGDLKERQSCQVTFSFKNPLDTPLTNCYLSVDGSGLMRPRYIAIEGDVDPEGQFTYTMRFRPRIHGDRKIIATFNSKELFDINGVKSFNVKKQYSSGVTNNKQDEEDGKNCCRIIKVGLQNKKRGRDYCNRLDIFRDNNVNIIKQRKLTENDHANPTSEYINKVKSVQWYIEENARSHKTNKYDLTNRKSCAKPVIRRGQVFRIGLSFVDREFNLQNDHTTLVFKFGAKPSVQRGTMGVLPIKDYKLTKTKDDWDVKIESDPTGRNVMLKVFAPASAPVGLWRLEVKCQLHPQHKDYSDFTFFEPTDLYMLFNPWCKDDSVYMENVADLEEYVMNENGKIYMDTYKQPRGRPWVFGQFDDVVLHVSAYILELASLSDTMRSNPVHVVRAIAAAINDKSNGGIMEDKWDGGYRISNAPGNWTGSVRIFEEYVSNGYQPVKYGQCWVFSALVTSVCRSLGIPCRSVTNFMSAHDSSSSSSSLVIDNFYNKDGKKLPGGPDGINTDSMWSFHVWNDVWMARSDLPKGYGGWQAIDATLQHQPNSELECGPASVEAIRCGDIGMDYDVPQLFSKVNMDVRYWAEDKNADSGFARINVTPTQAGRCVLTKLPGKDDDTGNLDKEDITSQYKTQNSKVLNHIIKQGGGLGSTQESCDFKSAVKEDVLFTVHKPQQTQIGQPLQIKVVAINQSNSVRTVKVNLSTCSVFYTGVQHSVIKKSEAKLVLAPHQHQNMTVTVQYNEYWKQLVEGCFINMHVVSHVQETKQMYAEEEAFVIEKPRLHIKNHGEYKVGKQCAVTISFINPLDTALTNCHLSIDGVGLLRPTTLHFDKDVDAFGQFSYTLQFSPRIHGSRKIVASFSSHELFDINSVISLHVNK